MRELFSDKEFEKLTPTFKEIVANSDLKNVDLSYLKRIDSTEVENIYGFAYGFYEAGKYKEALSFFMLLTAIRNKEMKYWKGLGACLQLLRRYEEAVESYSMAAFLDEELKDPYPHFHAAECLFTLNETKRALQALKSARKITKNENCFRSLIKRIDVLESVNKR